MPRSVLQVLAAALALAAPVRASDLTLSDASTDSTSASDLDAVLDTLTNTSAWFNLNELFCNAAPNVGGLSLTSAAHADGNADVTSAWPLVADVSAADFQELTSGPNPSLAAGVGGVGSRIAQPRITASSRPLPTRGSKRPHRVEREDPR